MAVNIRVTTDCKRCKTALELDQLWLVKLGGGEVALIACHEHLLRMLLAIVTLEGLETTLEMTIPQLPQAIVDALIVAQPGLAGP
jgi:hypothetical protein